MLRILLCLFLISCSPVVNTPTPFKVKEKIGTPEGCYELKQEIKKQNKEKGTNIQPLC